MRLKFRVVCFITFGLVVQLCPIEEQVYHNRVEMC